MRRWLQFKNIYKLNCFVHGKNHTENQLHNIETIVNGNFRYRVLDEVNKFPSSVLENIFIFKFKLLFAIKCTYYFE